ncbi:MAG: hypothetical protein VXV96_04445 [Bdellovibrionota bacterium]|nr:hypothetical protein [Bdellovibrionota bacterium]
MKSDLKIRFIDAEGQLISSFPIDKREQAFQFAEELEAMGIEFKMEEPSLPESLILSLGADDNDTNRLKKEIEEEIDDHGTDCCSAPKDTLLH